VHALHGLDIRLDFAQRRNSYLSKSIDRGDLGIESNVLPRCFVRTRVQRQQSQKQRDKGGLERPRAMCAAVGWGVALERTSGTVPGRPAIDELVEKVIIARDTITIALFYGAPIIVPWTPLTSRRKREVIEPEANQSGVRPIRAEARRKLVTAIAKSRFWLAELVANSAQSTYAIADREKQSERSIRMLFSLAFLAPDIVNAAVEGRLPIGFGQSRLFNLPLGWDEQMSLLGFASSADRLGSGAQRT
jgi:hypothetical protein